MKTGAKAIIVVGILLTVASGVAAQDEGGNFEVTPYFWAAGIEGDVTANDGTKYDVDMDFDDLFEAVDAGGGLMTVARSGAFVVFGQFDYVGMDSDELDPAPAGDSDLTWQVQPAIQYQINDNLAVRAGYRRVHYDVEGDHGNTFDAAFQGFLVGVSVMF